MSLSVIPLRESPPPFLLMPCDDFNFPPRITFVYIFDLITPVTSSFIRASLNKSSSPISKYLGKDFKVSPTDLEVPLFIGKAESNINSLLVFNKICFFVPNVPILIFCPCKSTRVATGLFCFNDADLRISIILAVCSTEE